MIIAGSDPPKANKGVCNTSKIKLCAVSTGVKVNNILIMLKDRITKSPGINEEKERATLLGTDSGILMTQPRCMTALIISVAKMAVIIQTNKPLALKLEAGIPVAPSGVTKLGVRIRKATKDNTIPATSSTL